MKRGGGGAPEVSTAGDALFRRRIGARAIPGRAPGVAWRVVERVTAGNADAAVRAIAEAAAGGANGVEIAFAGSLHPLGSRLGESAAPAIAAALAVALPDAFQLRIDYGGSPTIADAFLDLAARQAELVFTHDPIAAVAFGAATPDAARLNATATAFAARGFDGAVVLADGRLWHAGGATEEQELAATLATYVGLLRLIEGAANIDVALAADADQFRTIAKFRAMRLLLARVGEVAGLATPLPRIHGETAWRMMSARDPEMNILRATTAAFAAAVGGADSIAVLPFDAVGGGSDGHALRLARNTQTILAEEAHLFRVSDPGAGSGAIEALTAAFAEGAWQLFQAIEKEGGIVAAIAGDTLLPAIAEAREARLLRMARRDLRMIGVNAYTGDDSPAARPTRRAPGRQTLVFERLSEAFETAP
jgi:methylmalonyl-CoA mutase